MSKEEDKKKELEEHLKLQKAEKKSYFNKPLLFFSVITFAAGLNQYFRWYPVPEIVLVVILLLAGLWLFKLAMGGGFYGRRKDIFKKYI